MLRNCINKNTTCCLIITLQNLIFKLNLSKIISFTILVSIGNLHGQANDSLKYYYYRMFEDVDAKTNFLLNRGFVNPDRIEPFIIADSADISERMIFTNANNWQNVYNYLRESNEDSLFYMPPLNKIYLKPFPADPLVPLGIIFIDGNYVDPTSADSFFNVTTKKVLPNAPQKIVNIFSISNLRRTVSTQDVEFNINPDRIFINRTEPILSLEIDFDDGTGWHQYTTSFQNISIYYNNYGEKNLKFKLITSLDTLVSFSILYVSPRSINNPSNYSIEVKLPSGNLTGAKFSINLSCDKIFDKPFIVVEGFDPTDKVDLNETHTKYTNAGIAKYVYDYGYDLVSIQFENNNDYIQNNGQVVKEVIEWINANKIGNYENIIIGESMGGIATRVALSLMEESNIDHETRLYISFDSPHGGANTPLSIQQFGHDLLELNSNDLINFLHDFILDYIPSVSVGDFLSIGAVFSESLEDAHKSIKSNDSPAARQMLIRHYNYKHELNPDNVSFLSYLKSIGYPRISRNVALINGSLNAKEQIFDSDKYIDFTKEKGWFDCIADINIKAYVSPINRRNFTASRIQAQFICHAIGPDRSTAFTFFDKPYDSSPGSSKFVKIVDDNDFTFVPTVNSIDLDVNKIDGAFGLNYFNENSSNPQRHKKYIIENNLSPFDDIYADTNNTSHIRYEEIDNMVRKVEERELMFKNMYLQNRLFNRDVVREFYADSKMVIGREVNIWEDKEIEKGDFIVETGAKLEVTSGETIQLLPGVIIKNGADFHAYIQPDHMDCSPPVTKARDHDVQKTYKRIIPFPIINIDTSNLRIQVEVLNPYQDANHKDYQWTLKGDGIDGNYEGFEFSVPDLKTGQYSVICDLFKGERVMSKIFTVINDRKVINKNGIIKKPINQDDNINVSISPNPSQNYVKILFELYTDKNIDIKLIDLYGRTLLTSTILKKGAGKYEHRLTLEEIENGVYFLVFNMQGNISTKKIVIHK